MSVRNLQALGELPGVTPLGGSMTQHRNLPVPLDFPEQPMLIEHILNGDVIPQRPRDGYINATLLCQKSGKAFSDYSRLARTQAFLDELVSIWEFPYRH